MNTEPADRSHDKVHDQANLETEDHERAPRHDSSLAIGTTRSMNTSKHYTDSQGRSFYYAQGQRVYADGGKDLGVPVTFTPTPTPEEDPEVTRPLRPLQSKHLELAKAIQDAGFVAEECGVRDDKLACASPARDHGFSVALRSDHWFIWSWADRFYRGQGAARLQELCLLLLRNPPGVSTDSQHCSAYPLPKTIQQQFALGELDDTDEGLRQALWPSIWLAERFGFRHYSDAEEGKSAGLPQAWTALNQAWGEIVPIQPEKVCVNDELIYIPAPYYTIGGPGGFLFERRTGRGMTVRYPYPPDAVIWAYYHGFGWPDERRWGTVTIKAVRYPKWARSKVSTYESYDSTMREFARSLSNPPFVLRDVELTRQIALELFRDKELLDCFDFEVVPTRTEPGAAPNDGPATQSDNSKATDGSPSVI